MAVNSCDDIQVELEACATVNYMLGNVILFPLFYITIGMPTCLLLTKLFFCCQLIIRLEQFSITLNQKCLITKHRDKQQTESNKVFACHQQAP